MDKNSVSHTKMRVNTLLKVMKAIQDNAKNKNDIREKTDLSWGSCSETISLLSDKEVIVACKTEITSSNKPGRKASGFEFNKTKNLIIGIEIKQHDIICSLINFANIELANISYPLNKALDKNSIFNYILAAYNEIIKQAKIDTEAVIGVSISLTGGVDTKNKRWIFTPRLDAIDNIDFNELINIIPNIQYLNIEHDINAQALSVISSNKWEANNYAFLHFGEGVGMTFFNKELHTGHRGFAGEIGHIPYHPFKGEIKCKCGKTNCFEAFLSTQGIIKLVKEICNKDINSLNDIDNSIINNKELINILTDAISHILTIVNNIIDPKTIIIGGEALEPFMHKIQTSIIEKTSIDSWLGGTKNIKWYKSGDINCAYGTAVNSSNKIIKQYITDNLL